MAGRYPDRFLEELRRSADLVQYVSSYVALKQNGRRYWGLCPFHGEKTASFSVDPSQQLYYCFGCKKGGTVFTFIQEMEHLTFPEAIAFVADREHIPLPEMEEDPAFLKRKQLRARIYEANREAARFYHSTLFTPAGSASLAYLRSRGLNDSTIRKFGLGAAPDGYENLKKHLVGAQSGYCAWDKLLRCKTLRVDVHVKTTKLPARLLHPHHVVYDSVHLGRERELPPVEGRANVPQLAQEAVLVCHFVAVEQ